MSSVSLSELILLFVIGLLILGPERLPRVASQIGRWVGRARRTANQLRYQLEREVALAEFEQKKKEKAESRKTAAAASADQPEAAAGDAAAGTADSAPRSAGDDAAASASTTAAAGIAEGAEAKPPTDTSGSGPA